MVKGVGFALIGFLIVLVGVGAYLAGKKGVSIKISTPTSSPSVTFSSPMSTPQDETELIKIAVYTKLKSDASKLDVTVSKTEGNFAKGYVKDVGSEVGGGYFLAAKTQTGWVEVYDGQSQPTCSVINQYNFPKDMVPECLDANGKVVVR